MALMIQMASSWTSASVLFFFEMKFLNRFSEWFSALFNRMSECPFTGSNIVPKSVES